MKQIIEQEAKKLFEYMNNPLLWEAIDQTLKIAGLDGDNA